MSVGNAAEDAALLQWVTACLPAGQELPGSLEDLSDGAALMVLARRFVSGASAEEDRAREAPRQRRQRLAELVGRGGRPAVEPRAAQNGGLATTRALIAALLVAAVEGPEKETVIGVIVALNPTHQAVLAHLLQRAMQAPAGGTGGRRPSAQGRAMERAPSVGAWSCRSARSDRSAMSGRQTDLSPQDMEELRMEAREFKEKINDSEMQLDHLQEDHKTKAEELREVKDQLCRQADKYHDLCGELDEKKDEQRSLTDHVNMLKEELQHERGAVGSSGVHKDRLRERLDRVESECRAAWAHQGDLRQRLDEFETKGAHHQKKSWKRTALLAKHTRLEEQNVAYMKQLSQLRMVNFDVSERNRTVRQELEAAQSVLEVSVNEVNIIRERLQFSEENVHKVESELEDCTGELKVLKSGNVDGLVDELRQRRFMVENLERKQEEWGPRLHALSEEVELAEEATLEAQEDHASEAEVQASELREAEEHAHRKALEARMERNATRMAMDLQHDADKKHLKSTEMEVARQRRELGGIRTRLGAAEAEAKHELVEARSRITSTEVEIATLRDELEASQSAMKTAEASAEAYTALEKTEREMETSARNAAEAAEAARAAAAAAPLPELPPMPPVQAPVRKDKRLNSAPVAKASPQPSRARPRQATDASAADEEEAGLDISELKEQLLCRERELKQRETLAEEASAIHEREMRHMSSALHRLGVRYGRLRSQAQSDAESDQKVAKAKEQLHQAEADARTGAASGPPDAPAAKGWFA